MTGEWPREAGRHVVVVAERGSAVERRALRRWVRDQQPASTEVTVVHLDGPGAVTQGLAALAALAPGLDPYLLPVGIVWEPRAARRPGSVSLRELAVLGDPRRPRRALQPVLRRLDSHRCTFVVGAGAPLSELRRRMTESGHGYAIGDQDFAAFIGRQAVVAIESAVSRRIGPQYKIPRLMRQEIATSQRFSTLVGAQADSLGRRVEDVRAEAEKALDEMVTGWSRLLVDVQARFGRAVYKRGYDERIEYDQEQIDRVRSAVATRPSVLLMSHRSHLDGLVLPVAMLDNQLPRTHLLGGANMAVWPIGSLFRRSGVIFIRREFRDDPVYKAVLREYVGHLVEKRFHLQWSIEGTRSRTGKMQPPKLGLLAYVVDAFRQGRTDDVLLVPVSIAYDQLHEVREFAAFAGGSEKKPENLGYIVDYIRSQSQHFGKIYVNFAEPISVRDELTRHGGKGDPDPNELHKLAFEVSWRMNGVTPITGAALVTTVLLAARGRALTLAQIQAPLSELFDYAERRGLPLASSADPLRAAGGIEDMVTALTRSHVVQHFADGTEPVWRIALNQHLAASFYRNSLIHHYLDRSVAELALARVAASAGDDPLQLFWDEAFELRDNLKFDFFFPERDEFVASITSDLSQEDSTWQERVKTGANGAREVLESLRPLTAHLMLRSFIEAYEVVAHVLVTEPAQVDERQLRKRALQVGRQFLMQRRVSTPESVSALLFRTGVQLVAHAGLLEPGEDVQQRRQALATRLRDLHERLDAVEALAAARRSSRRSP
jgi:glycerol-3-phosphate O-acyltransferase